MIPESLPGVMTVKLVRRAQRENERMRSFRL